MPLRATQSPTRVIVSRVEFAESNGFDRPVLANETTDADPSLIGGPNGRVEINDQLCRLIYEHQEGEPRRTWARLEDGRAVSRDLIEVRVGEWTRLEYNLRMQDRPTGNWWYLHAVVNVAVNERIDANVFLASGPNLTVTRLSRLW